MKKIIILSKNYENYTSGYYHQDIVDAFQAQANCYLYGEGYPNYNNADDINNVISKSSFDKSNIDLIACSTSWDVDFSMEMVDPHPNIDLSNIGSIPKVYFLNKEYKKLDLRFEYIKKQKFDLVCTVHPNAENWQQKIGYKFLLLPFGISLNRFKDFGLEKIYDFGFTGGLHKSHIDSRILVKKEIFREDAFEQKANHGLPAFLKPNPIKKKYQKYNIYWAEYGARNFNMRSMLPSGKQYAKFLNQFKVFLNTPSAVGIMNTRFFELMATKTLILCPRSDMYMGILEDGKNCVMFNPEMSDFQERLVACIDDGDFRKKVVENASKGIVLHSYINRIKRLIEYMNL